jgi:hypothetical protein
MEFAFEFELTGFRAIDQNEARGLELHELAADF